MVKSGAVCLAYETVQTADKRLPLLVPMSEVAGRMASINGAYYLQKHPELIDFRQQVENRNAKLFGLGAVLSIIHAALETLVCVPVYFGQGLSGAETVRILLGLVLLGSFIHSMIDYALSLLIWRPVSGTMRTSRVS